MPPLQWARINPRAGGGGGATLDQRGDFHDALLLVHNYIFGIDGRMYPLEQSLAGSGYTTGADPTANWTMGPGGASISSLRTAQIPPVSPPLQGDHADSGGQSAAARYYHPPNSEYSIWSGGLMGGSGISSHVVQDTSDTLIFATPPLTPTEMPLPYDANNTIASLFPNPWYSDGVPSPIVLIPCAYPTRGNEFDHTGFLGCKSTTTGYPTRDVAAITVTADLSTQPGGATYVLGTNTGAFILYQSATNWFLTKFVADAAWAGAQNIRINPEPSIGFAATSVTRFPVWGGADATIGNSVQPPHATGAEGAYLAALCSEYFQGRILAANVMFAPKYTVAGDIADRRRFVRKRNRIVWTILNGEKPTRGPFTTNSDGLTQLQFPWSIEVNNYVDAEGIGDVLQMFNMGDNQLFVIGTDGCARLTGYLSTAVLGVNASTFDIRPIMKSPGAWGPGCGVITRHGVYFAGKKSIYLYDGNGIHDVLEGHFKALYNRGPMVQKDAKIAVGKFDDDHIYFGPFAGYNQNPGAAGASTYLLININTGRMMLFGQPINGNVSPNGSAYQGKFWSCFNTAGIVDASTVTKAKVPLPETFSGGAGHLLGGQLARGDAGAIVTRPFGSLGVPKRFRHVVVEYGFNGTVANSPTVYLRYLFGPDFFDPYIQFGDITSPSPPHRAPILGTIPPSNATSFSAGESMQTKSIMFSFDDIALQNPRNVVPQPEGWSDQVMFIFDIDYGANKVGTFIPFAIDVSWIEVPSKRGVMVKLP